MKNQNSNLLKRFQKNVLLKKYASFRIGGPAKYFFVAENEKDLVKAIQFARARKLPFFILGGGSNLLVSDRGFKGVVIKCQMSNVKCQSQNLDVRTIYVEAGVRLSSLVNFSLENSLTGLEWAAGIPGTVGGAIYGNAGAFGHSIQELIRSVSVLDARLQKVKFTNRDCHFGYRESIFKNKKDLIILAAEMILKKSEKSKVQKKILSVLSQRRQRQPLGFSAGSIFKNYKGKISDRKILEAFPQLKIFNARKIIPAGFLIEACGLKGKKIGEAYVSREHANFIVNTGNARFIDVLSLIDLIKEKVKDKFGILLEEEIRIIGDERLGVDKKFLGAKIK